jgi:hypothetical protein
MMTMLMDVDAPPSTHAPGKAPASASAPASAAAGVDREALRAVALALYEADEALQAEIEAARALLGAPSAHPLPPASVSTEEILEYARVATRVRPYRATWRAARVRVRVGCVCCCGRRRRVCVRVCARARVRLQP